MVQIKPTCQAENRDTGVENKGMDTKTGKKGWDEWGTGIDMYALLILCIKQTINGNLLLRFPKPEGNLKEATPVYV